MEKSVGNVYGLGDVRLKDTEYCFDNKMHRRRWRINMEGIRII